MGLNHTNFAKSTLFPLQTIMCLLYFGPPNHGETLFESVPALQDADAPRKTSSAQQRRWWPNAMFVDGASMEEFVEAAPEI